MIKQTILELVKLTENPVGDAEERIPVLLNVILKTCKPATAVKAEAAFTWFRAAHSTCAFSNPRLWGYRFGKFIDLVEEITKDELGEKIEMHHQSFVHDDSNCNPKDEANAYPEAAI